MQIRSTDSAASGLPWFVLLFLCSGCAALIYEVVWYQSLTLIIGSNAVSIAVVLATYMGGMGLGSLVYLRWRRLNPHPLKVYAQLELLIAVFGFLVLTVLPWAGGLYTSIGGGGFAGILWRGLFCALFLLLPAMAMGATLPAAAAWVRSTPQGIGWIGYFYATNIAGGVAGCLLAAFYLLRVHDNAYATYVAMSLNVAVALVAWLLARHYSQAPAFEGLATIETAPAGSPLHGAARTSDHRAVLWAIAISGACALGAEVIWTRNLALLLGGTVYTFALILAAMLFGLWAGSSIGATIARATQRPRRALAICQLLAMLGLAWAAYMQLSAMPNWPINPQNSPSPWYMYQVDFLRCLVSIVPPALCWGASFPLAIASLAEELDRSGARATARVYAANTGGAIVGALLTSLVLIPAIGTQTAQRLWMLLALLGALSLLLPAALAALRDGSSGASRRWLGVTASIALFSGALLMVPKIPGVLVGYGRWAVTWLAAHGEFIYVGEGLNSTLTISRMSNGITNYHNAGKVQASSETSDMRLQRMLGHMTTLLSRDPKRVLVIGCGAGVTAGAVSINPRLVKQTIAEIEPLVPQAADTYFSEHNHGVIRNPKVEVRIDDARHYLLTSEEKFDAITMDPFDTWVKGAATLNTREFYQEIKRHLNPGGVVTVWVQFYETNREAFKSEFATFAEVFPGAAVFGNTSGGQGYDGVLVGSLEPLNINLDEFDARLASPEYAEVKASLSQYNYGTAVELLGTFAATAEQLKTWMADAQINRDKNLRLQYLAGMGLNEYAQGSIYREILGESRWPEGLFSGSETQLAAMRNALEVARR